MLRPSTAPAERTGFAGSHPYLTGIVGSLFTGLIITLSIPPFGWWPLAFVGVALWDRLLAGASWGRRFRRTWLVGLAWLGPAMLWMADLTPPGYAVAVVLFSTYFAIAGAVIPPGAGRWIAFPGAVVLGHVALFHWPWGGVPLAHLALTQAGSCPPPCAQLDSPLAQTARLLGPLLVVALVVVAGLALSALWERRRQAAIIGFAVVGVVTIAGVLAPRGHEVDGGEVRLAIVQGGGPQNTPSGNADAANVFQRHVDETRRGVQKPVDIVLWPENVVAVFGTFENSYEHDEITKLARELDATFIVGITEDATDSREFLNASVVVRPDGTIGDRYDKVLRVPFGEFVPFRDFIETNFPNAGAPPRDAVPGTGPATLDTDHGTMGVVISWEDFFDRRARDAISNGGEVLMNPTNGASYWLTEVQTQQIASSRLRAIETGRWHVQAAPTGFSALINPDGRLLERTDISVDGTERAVADTINAVVPKRTGNTLFTTVGSWPMMVLAVASVVLGWVVQRRSDEPVSGEVATAAATGGAGDGDDPADATDGLQGGEAELTPR